MINVFVSYRRDDSPYRAGQLYDYLVDAFGRESVSRHLDLISPGQDLREALTQRVAGSKVLLAVIGDKWLSGASSSGGRPLDDPGDSVRIEIEAALTRGIPIIPVLLGGTSVPKAEELPTSLRGLASGIGIALRPNPDFQHDVERVIGGIKAAASGPPRARSRPRRVRMAGLAALTAVVGVILLLTILHMATDKGRVAVEPDDAKDTVGKGPIGPDPTAARAGDPPPGPVRTMPVEPPAPPAKAPSAAKEPVASPVVASTKSRRVSRPLFNGKDTAGWKTHPRQPGNWHVENGVLIGSGPAPSHLYTERGDFTDFHLRIEARYNKGGTGGVHLRCPFVPSMTSTDDAKWPDGFQATINDARFLRGSTGGLYPGEGETVFVQGRQLIRVPSKTWFTMEVIADGKTLVVLVNGETTAYAFAPKRLPASGHIALQQYSAETVIEFRKIEIEEPNRARRGDPRDVGRVLGQSDRVTRVLFLPDDPGVLSGESATEFWRKTGGPLHFSARPYSLRSWELEGGRPKSTMRGAGVSVSALALSSDGRYAASSPDVLHPPPILIWDLKTGKSLHRLQRQDPIKDLHCTALSFSPDDRRVMVALANGTVIAWDLATEQEQAAITLKGAKGRLQELPCAAFTADRRHLITGSQTGVVELWDLPSGQSLGRFAGHEGEVRQVAGSADSRLILSAGSDNTVRLWDVAAGKEIGRLDSDDRQVRCVAFSPDGRMALTAGLDGPVHLWDLQSGREVYRMEGHAMGVNSVAFSPDGRRAVSGGDDRTVRLWQLPASGVGGGPPSRAGGTAAR